MCTSNNQLFIHSIVQVTIEIVYKIDISHQKYYFYYCSVNNDMHLYEFMTVLECNTPQNIESVNVVNGYGYLVCGIKLFTVAMVTSALCVSGEQSPPQEPYPSSG